MEENKSSEESEKSKVAKAKKAEEPKKPEKKVEETPVLKVSPPKVSENKIKFATWFPIAVKKYKDVKVHHMGGIEAFFKSVGIGVLNTPEAYEEGLKKYGYGRK